MDSKTTSGSLDGAETAIAKILNKINDNITENCRFLIQF